MTLEGKELLLKYLCMALPYGVIIHIHDINVDDFDNYLNENYLSQIRVHKIIAKPYLRSMSNMTEEEYEEYCYLNECTHLDDGTEVPCIAHINYLLKHHFDFMGLIPKNLAIEVTENNNPYKNYNYD